MSLGRFGGSAPDALRVAAGGSQAQGDLMHDARDRLTPSPEGMPATTPQFYLPAANYGINLLKNGDFESWSGGTSAVPDAWSIASGTVAKDTTNIRRGSAGCQVTANLNAVCDLSQSITISASQNVQLRNRTITLSAQVVCATASRVRLTLYDGIIAASYSAYHSGSNAFEELSVTFTLASTATQLYMGLEFTAGASIAATIDAAIAVEGASAVAFSPHPNDQHLRLSNFQSTTPTNNTDQGIWRSEIGAASGSAAADVTVTFETAFRTFRVVLVGPTNASSGDHITTNTQGVSSFAFATYDSTGARKAFNIYWMAIGHV